jgi:FlaA1/EpsC-like NDP-sugar epimerase
MTSAFKPISRALVFSALTAGMIILAGLSAFLLRFDFSIPPYYVRHLPLALGCWLVVKMTTFHFYRLNRSSYRFFSADDAVRLARANVVGSLLSTVLLYLLAGPVFPRSVLILIWCCAPSSLAPAFWPGDSHGGAGRKATMLPAGTS